MSAGVIEVRVPDIGDFEDVEVIEILVGPGDAVGVEDPLLTIESDKASMEIPSPQAGVVESLTVKLGDKVSEGSLLLTLRGDGAAAAPSEPEPAAKPEPVAAPAPEVQVAPPAPKPAPAPSAPVSSAPGVHASPKVRRVAREWGADLAGVQGSGPHGRILEQDVQDAVRATLKGGSGPTAPAPPAVDFAQFGETEVVPLSRVQKVSGRNLSRSWQSVPHVTQHDEADVTDLEAFRKAHAPEVAERGVKLTFLPFLLKACVQALRAFPQFGASLDPGGENLVLKHYFHIGVAVDTERGLVVPVVRDVEQKGLVELAAELAELAERARSRKLAPADLQGGVMSVSSLGGIGGTFFTPIVNAPEVCVLGVSRTQTRPIWQETEAGDGAFVPRRILPLSLSYDHRVIDGAQAARFTTHLARSLSQLEHLLL